MRDRLRLGRGLKEIYVNLDKQDIERDSGG